METRKLLKILGQSVLATIGFFLYIAAGLTVIVTYYGLAGYIPDPSKGPFHIDNFVSVAFILLVYLVFPMSIKYKMFRSYILQMMWFLVPLAAFQLAIRLPEGSLSRNLIASRSWLLVAGFLTVKVCSFMRDRKAIALLVRS